MQDFSVVGHSKVWKLRSLRERCFARWSADLRWHDVLALQVLVEASSQRLRTSGGEGDAAKEFPQFTG